MEQAPMKRDSEQVEREYNREKWPAIDRAIQAIIDDEREPRLDRVLARAARNDWYGERSLIEREHVFGGREANTPTAVAFGGQSALVRELILASCTPETDLLVELGAGWAFHLLSAWIGGGPAEATYVAAEYTEAGRGAATRLEALDPALAFRAIAFDYNAPALDEAGGGRHAVVFSQHSIEQIPHVKPELFAAIRGVAERVTCIHFEPVGWQVEGTGPTGSSAAYAERHDYNRNLISALEQEQASGSLTLDRVEPNIVGVNPHNATTVALWSA